MERRLAAILATDVVGYSRLIRADEEGTLATLKALRTNFVDPKLAEHNGRIVKLMGDGMLAEFASVVDAVRAAVETQVAVAEHNAGLPKDKRIEFRAGINLGDVVIDGDDIYGDGVNVAARLEALAEPGGVCVSGMVYEGIRDRIDVPFEDLGEREVKNIDRPVRVWRWASNTSTAEQNSEGIFEPLPLPDKPSIAVLPFDNMSGDPEQEYFSDGISEEITTALSRFRNFLVIARNTMFTYKGKAIDVRDVSREVNARYIVEGSVRKAGNRVRVMAQLIEGESGAHVWADRYEGVLEDVFELQDEITTAIVTAVAPQYLNAEISRATRRTGAEYDAWELLMRARWHMGRYNAEDATEAERLFREVLRHNPRDAEAQAWLAFLFLLKVTWGWEEDPMAAMHEGIAAGRRAAALDSMDAQVLAISGIMMTWEGAFERGIETCRRAVQRNPNLALAYGLLAATLGIAGSYEQAREALAVAQRLSPLDPEMPCFLTAVSLGAFAKEQYQDVLDMVEEVIAANPDVPSSYRLKAAALVMLGHEAEAHKTIKQLQQVAPNYSLRVIREFLPLQPEILERHIVALRKAGLPE
jgi:adenylate cyclase